jgi:hypothetical protein
MTSATSLSPQSAGEPGTPPPDARVFSYVVDGGDHIVALNAAWVAFAAENGAAGLEQSVIGSPVWRYIVDPATEHLYAHLFRQVRRSHVPVRVPFRCDAPGLVREMELEIAPGQERMLVLRAWVVRQRARASVALLDPRAPRSDALVRMCSWCKRVALGEAWVDVETAVAASRLFHRSPVPGITHAMCEDCEHELNGRLGSEPTGQ